MSDESTRTARQIHEQGPYIPEDEARDFYISLGHISSAEGSVRICLWVLARVLEHTKTR